MLTITGGKLTTWRRMAKLTVDRLVERDSRDAPCRTHEIPLGQAIAVEDLPRVEGVPGESYAALAGRYGYAAREVLALARDEAAASWPSRSSPACPTCWPRWRSPPAASRRAASATCCCAAPALGCWPRASCRRDAWPTCRSARRGARARLGWSAAREEAEIERSAGRGRGRRARSARGRAVRST